MRIAGDFDAVGTLQGGQSFRWLREGSAFVGTSRARLLRIEPSVEGPDAKGAPRAWLERYLGLTREDDARRERLARDPVLAPAVRAHPGLRLLRQDPWEATAAFVTSANNNVKRIEGSMLALERRYGAPLAGGRNAFPTAQRIARASEKDLLACGLGYRAPFLRETARRVAEGALDGLEKRDTRVLRDELLGLPGVGPKVADCIALFGYARSDAFPIDRWVLRAMSEAFFGGREAKAPQVEAFARARWGADAGLAQQYLFHTVRLRGRAAVGQTS